MAFASCSVALIFPGRRSSASVLTLAVWAMLLSLGFAWTTGEPMPGVAGTPAIGTALAVGALYLLPVLAITLWSAQRLPPALLSFLFTLEIVSGVVSGALFLDEPFGLWRFAGGLLIVGVALIEALAALRAAARSASEPVQ